MVLLCTLIVSDEDYWAKSPQPLHLFMIIQYLLLALFIKLPVYGFNNKTLFSLMCFVFLIIKINSVVGVYWLN